MDFFFYSINFNISSKEIKILPIGFQESTKLGTIKASQKNNIDTINVIFEINKETHSILCNNITNLIMI